MGVDHRRPGISQTREFAPKKTKRSYITTPNSLLSITSALIFLFVVKLPPRLRFAGHSPSFEGEIFCVGVTSMCVVPVLRY